MADPASLAQQAGELAGDAGALSRKLDALSQQLALAAQPVGERVRRLRFKQRAHCPADMGRAALRCK